MGNDRIPAITCLVIPGLPGRGVRGCRGDWPEGGGQITAQIKAWFEWIYGSQMRGEQGRSARWRRSVNCFREAKVAENQESLCRSRFPPYLLTNTGLAPTLPFFFHHSSTRERAYARASSGHRTFKIAWPPRRIHRRAFPPLIPKLPPQPSRMAAP